MGLETIVPEEAEELSFLLKIFRKDYGGIRDVPMWACPHDTCDVFGAVLDRLEEAEQLRRRVILPPSIDNPAPAREGSASEPGKDPPTEPIERDRRD